MLLDVRVFGDSVNGITLTGNASKSLDYLAGLQRNV
jgi:hypothetical protein